MVRDFMFWGSVFMVWVVSRVASDGQGPMYSYQVKSMGSKTP